MRTSDDGKALIKAFESVRLKPYQCSAGVWTIGIGHTSAAGGLQVTKSTPPITEAEAYAMFDDDLKQYERAVTKACGPLEQHQFDALVGLCFNIGIGAFAGSTAAKRAKAGNHERVPEAIMWWNKSKGEVLDGLTRRRRAEAALYRGDFEEAARIAGSPKTKTTPRAVDKPKPPKTMATSKTGNAAAATGVAGLGVAYEGVKASLDVANEVKGVASDAGGFLGLSGSTAVMVGLGVLIVACAAWIWWDRRKKLHEDLV